MFTHEQTLCTLSAATSNLQPFLKMQQASSIQEWCSSTMSLSLTLCSWSSANENEVMGILAAIVMDVERDTSQNHNTPFLQHTYSPPSVSKHAEWWASGSSWLGNKGSFLATDSHVGGQFQWKDLWGNEEERRGKKFTLSFPFDNENPNWATKPVQRWKKDGSLKDHF